MAQNFLHGPEVVNITQGPRPVREVRTAVIGLVGIFPTGPINVPTLVRNDEQAAQFGAMLPGFEGPAALNFIFGHNAGTVVVVNVFDPEQHTIAVVEEVGVVAAGALKLANAPIGAVVLKKADGTASTYVKGTDYTLDVFGNFKVIAGRIPNGTTIKFDYSKLDAASVAAADIIGDVSEDGNPTGIKAFDLSFNQFGFRPKILLAPGRSATKAIAEALISAADRLRAVPLIDSTYGDDVETTVADRGDATTAFGTSSKRAILLFPFLKGYNPATDAASDFPMSMFYAGLMAWTDNEYGYWFSPSAKDYRGVLGVERPISANISDGDTDTNVLNAAGIVTVFNSFGTGFKAWGNRNASFPTNTDPESFIPLVRTFDVVHESLEQAALPFMDMPITQSLIDDILQSGNDFISVLVGRGALTPGSRVVFDRAKNPNNQLAAGQLRFTIIKDGPSPAERITYESIIDTSLKTRAIG